MQRTSMPHEANAVLQYWSVSTIDVTVFVNVYISVLECLDEVKKCLF